MSFGVGAACVLALAFAGEGAEFEFEPVVRPPVGPPATPAEIEAATAFLADGASSAEAARVTFDMLMATAVAGDKATADEMRKRLIFDQAGSIQQRFLLTTIDVNAFRALLIAEGKSRPFTREFSQKYCRTIGLGHQAWGAQLLAEDNFLIQCSVAAQGAGDKALLDYCRKQLTEPREPENDVRRQTRAAAEILFAKAMTPAEKSLALHAIEGHESAVWLAEHFDSRVPDSDRDRADLAEARIERLLVRKQFIEALPAIEILLDKHGESPKPLFWRAWCEAAIGKSDSLEHMSDLVRAYPDDPWAVPARQAEQAIAQFDLNLKEQADVVARAVRKAFSDKIELVEATGEWKRNSGVLGLYLSADLRSHSGEAIVTAGDKWLAALRYETDRTQLLLDSESQINRFHGGIPFSLPRPVVHIDPVSRHFNFSVNMHTNPGIPSLDPQTETSIALLRNLQPAMVRPMLENAIEEGWLPIASEEDRTGTTYRWVTFSPRKPHVETGSAHISHDHRLTSVECPLFTLRKLNYGVAGTFELKPPAWPDLPIVEHETFDASVLFRLMAAVSQVFIDDAPSAIKAAQAADTVKQ